MGAVTCDVTERGITPPTDVVSCVRLNCCNAAWVAVVEGVKVKTCPPPPMTGVSVGFTMELTGTPAAAAMAVVIWATVKVLEEGKRTEPLVDPVELGVVVPVTVRAPDEVATVASVT